MHRDCRRTFFTDDGVRPLAPSVRFQTRVVALASTHSSDVFPQTLPFVTDDLGCSSQNITRGSFPSTPRPCQPRPCSARYKNGLRI